MTSNALAPDVLRIAVISDLHACETKDQARNRSFLFREMDPALVHQHPYEALKKLIRDEGLSADLLICPGDFGDQAHPSGIRYGWEVIHGLGKVLGAATVLGTVGNHDMDYKNNHGSDASAGLKSLIPSFPTATSIKNNEFWASYFTVVNLANTNIVLLNSSCLANTPEAAEHGEIPDHALESLKSAISKLDTSKINLLVCHHHPLRQAELLLGTKDDMVNGQLLLDFLSTGLHGYWMVVHGHKHHPKLQHAPGSTGSAIVWSAGSFASLLYPQLWSHVRNQVYFLDVDVSHLSKYGLVGTFESYSFHFELGWKPATANEGLPFRGGFGFRGSVAELARKVDQSLSGGYVKWPDLATSVPEIQYLMPSALRHLQAVLRNDHRIAVDLNEQSVPVEVSRL